MSAPHETIAHVLLEDDQPPGAPTPDKKALWDKAYATLLDLEKLQAKRLEMEKEYGLSIRWNRALAHVGHKSEDTAGQVQAWDLSSLNSDMAPPGSSARRVWPAFRRKYSHAIVGAHLKSGGMVLFKEPLANRGMPAVPTYEEFEARQAENQANQQPW